MVHGKTKKKVLLIALLGLVLATASAIGITLAAYQPSSPVRNSSGTELVIGVGGGESRS